MLVKVILLLCFIASVLGDYTFDDEISHHAQVTVADVVQKPIRAATAIENTLRTGVADLTQPITATKILFYGLKVVFHPDLSCGIPFLPFIINRWLFTARSLLSISVSPASSTSPCLAMDLQCQRV